MDDPNYIRAMMQGEVQEQKKNSSGTVSAKGKTEKSQLDKDLEREIDAYVDNMDLEEDHAQNALQSPAMKRAKIKQELKDAIKLPDLTKQLEIAMAVLLSEGENYLSAEDNQNLLTDFINASTALSEIKFEEGTEINLQEATKISNESMKSIVEIAIAKFNEERYSDCLALFSLLSILNPAYAEYWFRLGIAAQKCDQNELAYRAYSAAIELDPDHIGARLFAAECLIAEKKAEDAKRELAEAKRIIKDQTVDPMWPELLASLENSVQAVR